MVLLVQYYAKSHSIQVYKYTVVVTNDLEVQRYVQSYNCHFPGTPRDQMDCAGVLPSTAQFELRLQQVYVSYESENRSHCRFRGDSYVLNWSRCRSIIIFNFTRRNMMVSNSKRTICFHVIGRLDHARHLPCISSNSLISGTWRMYQGTVC